MKEKNMFDTLKEVFRKPNYLVLAVIFAFVFYWFSISISHFSLFGFLGSFKSFILFSRTIKIYSLITTIIISLLFGILFSLIAYRTKLLKETIKHPGVLTTIGIFFGILAPGCAACGIGLISALGLGAVTISLLPLKGLEFSLLSILLLLLGIFQMSRKINKGLICRVNINIDERRLKNER